MLCFQVAANASVAIAADSGNATRLRVAVAPGDVSRRVDGAAPSGSPDVSYEQTQSINAILKVRHAPLCTRPCTGVPSSYRPLHIIVRKYARALLVYLQAYSSEQTLSYLPRLRSSICHQVACSPTFVLLLTDLPNAHVRGYSNAHCLHRAACIKQCYSQVYTYRNTHATHTWHSRRC